MSKPRIYTTKVAQAPDITGALHRFGADLLMAKSTADAIECLPCDECEGCDGAAADDVVSRLNLLLHDFDALRNMIIAALVASPDLSGERA